MERQKESAKLRKPLHGFPGIKAAPEAQKRSTGQGEYVLRKGVAYEPFLINRGDGGGENGGKAPRILDDRK